jgi:hypothetical protein
MKLKSNKEQNQAIKMLLKSDEYTKLKVARELIRQVMELSTDYTKGRGTDDHWPSVKEGLKDIDSKLVFVLGCINMGRLIEQNPISSISIDPMINIIEKIDIIEKKIDDLHEKIDSHNEDDPDINDLGLD